MTTENNDGPASPPEGWQAEVTSLADEEIRSIVCPRCAAYAGDSCHSLASSGWKAIKPHQSRVAAAINARREGSK